MEIDDNQNIPCNILKEYHDSIIQDIQGDMILALFETQVLTENEYNNIKSERNREKEASRLLELLPSKGRNGINQFLNHLSTHYSWIARLLQHSITIKYNVMFSKKIQESLTAGEVPQLSSRHVSRVKHVKTLKKLLTELEVNNFIIVNGMTGCGKSSLVVEVLNDPFITMQYFQGFVQWIHVGQENSSHPECIQTEILNRLNNQEQLITPPLIIDYEETRKKIRDLWKQKQLTGGLLILDDVCSNEIVKSLDIGCKILITTNDISIMDDIIDTRVKYLKVNEGFEEKETLDLFSKCLSVDLRSLPSHASKLHSICKGFPLTISLIAAQLEVHREETINNTDRWEFYLNELSDKTSEPFKYTRHSQNQFKSLEKAIEMCIKSLPDDLQKNYQDFSIFVEDLNIKPEVLSILWNINQIEVEDIMSELMRKSLVVRVWNQPLNSYVYSIHDLLLSNLKKMMNRQEYKALHKKCIDRYRDYCKGNFANLPKTDNYIFLYFGYHLKNADMLEEFPQWFLNLRFIESKICATGPADLLADLKKYKTYIVVQSTYEYIKEIENFVKRCGPNLYRTKCDIVQLGLQEPETSFIYTESYKLAKASTQLYFYYDIRPSQNFHPEPHISIVRDKIETVIFGNRHDEVLIATNSGSIKLWNIISDKCLYTYNGHTKVVTHLVKNKLKNLFLSTSDDSTIRIWNMNSFPESENSKTRTPSPESRQEHWQNVYHQDYKRPTGNINTDCVFVLKHDSPVIFAQFSPYDDTLVVSSSTDKTLKIWKLKDGNYAIHKSFTLNCIINRCYFVGNMTHEARILFSTLVNGPIKTSAIYRCEWPFDHYAGLFYFKEKLLSFFYLPSSEGQDKMLVMTPNLVRSYEFNWENENKTSLPTLVYPKPVGYRHYKLSSISEENTYNNFRYIAFSLSNSTIKICDLSNGYNFLDLYNSNEGISNLDWFWSRTDQSNWLLSAANKSIRLWCLKDITQYACAHKTNTTNQSNSNLENECKNEILSLLNYKLFSEDQNLYCYKLQRNFDAVWVDNDSVLVAAVTKCGTLKVLFEGLDQWSMIDKRVLALTIVQSHQCVDQTMIIVACKDFSVYSLKFQTSEYLFKTSQLVEQIFACFDCGDLTIAFLLKQSIKKIDQAIEIWSNKKKYEVIVHDLINCFVFHDKVILLYNVHDIYILNLLEKSTIKLEINCIKINGSLMLDPSNLAVVNNGNCLEIYLLTSDWSLNLIYKYPLSFLEHEATPISVSNNKRFIAIGGQKHIVCIDKKLNAHKKYTFDPSVNNIQSMIWSSDDTRITIKEDNQIITLDVESGIILASVKLTVDKFFANPILNKYIAVNTTGQLVKLNLPSDS
ncbi:apoptotic protease-activating factor 1-like [Metopolophium dirhodum]|uniref:apoptotic protease-activating factor 1-like n=1 Tax=Metopolophium dirhodum TaxID=44670 RepID=UPI00298FC52E|nr:apoptotic protease-activating factor 1-like [Metopolophium dirhodum]